MIEKRMLLVPSIESKTSTVDFEKALSRVCCHKFSDQPREIQREVIQFCRSIATYRGEILAVNPDNVVESEFCCSYKKYLKALRFLQTEIISNKIFPGLLVTWTDPFWTEKVYTSSDLDLERLAIIYHVASVYSAKAQNILLAEDQDLKDAIRLFGISVSILKLLNSLFVVTECEAGCTGDSLSFFNSLREPCDILSKILVAKKSFMVYEKAVESSTVSKSLISKLAMASSLSYEQAAHQIRAATTISKTVADNLLSVEFYAKFMRMVSQSEKADDELERAESDMLGFGAVLGRLNHVMELSSTLGFYNKDRHQEIIGYLGVKRFHAFHKIQLNVLRTHQKLSKLNKELYYERILETPDLSAVKPTPLTIENHMSLEEMEFCDDLNIPFLQGQHEDIPQTKDDLSPPLQQCTESLTKPQCAVLLPEKTNCAKQYSNAFFASLSLRVDAIRASPSMNSSDENPITSEIPSCDAFDDASKCRRLISSFQVDLRKSYKDVIYFVESTFLLGYGLVSVRSMESLGMESCEFHRFNGFSESSLRGSLEKFIPIIKNSWKEISEIHKMISMKSILQELEELSVTAKTKAGNVEIMISSLQRYPKANTEDIGRLKCQFFDCKEKMGPAFRTNEKMRQGCNEILRQDSILRGMSSPEEFIAVTAARWDEEYTQRMCQYNTHTINIIPDNHIRSSTEGDYPGGVMLAVWNQLNGELQNASTEIENISDKDIDDWFKEGHRSNKHETILEEIIDFLTHKYHPKGVVERMQIFRTVYDLALNDKQLTFLTANDIPAIRATIYQYNKQIEQARKFFNKLFHMLDTLNQELSRLFPMIRENF